MIEFKGLSLAPDFTVRSEKNIRQAQNYIDNEVVRRLEDYTPIAMERFKNRGKMSKAHKVQTPGVIINTEPKARREYYINKGFSGKLRGKFWLEKQQQDVRISDIILKGVKGK